MLGQELDRFVQENAGHCIQCKNLCLCVGRDWTDLNQAVKKASRWGAAKHMEEVKKLKAKLTETRRVIEMHIKEH